MAAISSVRQVWTGAWDLYGSKDGEESQKGAKDLIEGVMKVAGMVLIGLLYYSSAGIGLKGVGMLFLGANVGTYLVFPNMSCSVFPLVSGSLALFRLASNKELKRALIYLGCAISILVVRFFISCFVSAEDEDLSWGEKKIENWSERLAVWLYPSGSS